MNTTIRDILAVMAGVFLSAIIVLAIQMLGHFLFPVPAGMDPEDAQSVALHMAEISVGAMLFVLLAWFLGALAGTWLALRAAPIRKKMAGGLVGFVQWLMAVQTLNMVPHPMWMTITGLLAAPLATFLVFMIVGAAPDDEENEDERANTSSY